ncbi:MAG: hypothetical protein LUO89_04695 [Methanothrix sp.]|nr:hypothetical protein [Methanothrix sp.]
MIVKAKKPNVKMGIAHGCIKDLDCEAVSARGTIKSGSAGRAKWDAIGGAWAIVMPSGKWILKNSIASFVRRE